MIRLGAQVGRAAPPVLVFARLLLAFELMQADHRWVGVNLVQPEDDPVALRDYTLQMGMTHYLHGIYRVGHITLHAGELCPAWSPRPTCAVTSGRRWRSATPSEWPRRRHHLRKGP